MTNQAQATTRKSTRASRAKQSAAAKMVQTPEQQADAIVAESQAPAAWNWPVGANFAQPLTAEQQAQQDADDAAVQDALYMGPNKPETTQDESSDDADLKREQAMADAIANAQQTSTTKGKKEYIKNSSIARPTKVAWAIYDRMFADAEEQGVANPTRGECIAEAIARGIASGTAATQYQYWKKASGR